MKKTEKGKQLGQAAVQKLAGLHRKWGGHHVSMRMQILCEKTQGERKAAGSALMKLPNMQSVS